MEEAATPERASLDARSRLMVGATLFSMFFGAGNLILPPLLGLQAGPSTPEAMAGFLVSAIGLPVLGIVAVALSGNLRTLASHVHPLFASAFVALVYLSIGPFLAIPRTASTSFEMLAPLLPAGVPVALAQLVFSVAFFAAAFALALRPGRLSRILGKVSAPALIALIVLVVGAALAMPGESQPEAVVPYDANAGMQGFIVGYQTMDLLAALNFGIVIAMNVRSLGVREPARVAREISVSGLMAGALMLVIYCGLAFVGFSAGGVAAGASNGAVVLAASATEHFGVAGNVLVAAIFLIACLNVCTGLVSCCSEYFSETVPRVGYRVWAAGFAAFSCVVSNFGLDAILAFSVPLLNALYPVAIVLVAFGMLRGFCDRFPRVWPWTVGVVAALSVVTSLRDVLAPEALTVLIRLPLAPLGLGWVVPALAGVALGVAHSALEAPRRRRDG